MQLLTPERSEIDRIWSLLPHPKDTIVRVFARHRETEALDGDYVRSASEMYHFARVNADKQVYVCPQPALATATKGVRHNAKDTAYWSYLLLDMDPIEDVYDPEPALEEALLWLGEWAGRNFAPGSDRRPLIIDSGRGRQAWVHLGEHELMPDGQVELLTFHGDFGTATQVTSWDRRTARKVCGYWLNKIADKVGLCHGCKLDTSTSDLPRPMRMPGTYNQKTGRIARIVEPGVTFHGLADLLVTGTPEDKLKEPDVIPVAAGTCWQKCTHRLTLSARTYLREGRAEPGRHKAMWHTAKKLQELGLPREEVYRALVQADKKQGETQRLGLEAIEHALDTAFGG
jgi:hypothetical protein